MPLGRLSTSKRGAWHLPVGGVWRLKVQVYDVWGAMTTDFGQVLVPLPHKAPLHTCHGPNPRYTPDTSRIPKVSMCMCMW